MATYTDNYNLKKPAGSDFFNVEDMNDNMDILDETLHEQSGNITQLNVIKERTNNSGAKGTASVNLSINRTTWTEHEINLPSKYNQIKLIISQTSYFLLDCIVGEMTSKVMGKSFWRNVGGTSMIANVFTSQENINGIIYYENRAGTVDLSIKDIYLDNTGSYTKIKFKVKQTYYESLEITTDTLKVDWIASETELLQ